MKHVHGWRSLVALAATLPLLASCGGAGAQSGSAGGTGPRVVASFYPLEYVAQRVVGDDAQVQNLTAPGLEPHDLELTVQQSAEIAEADIAFYEQGFQPAIDEGIEQADPEHVVEAGDVVSLEAEDPHFWLDPARMVKLAAAFRTEMSEVDPDHTARYRANFESLRHDLERLDQDYDSGLADCQIDTVVVSHDAFSYLGKFDLEFVAINGLSPDAEPSPAHIAELQDLVGSEGITTIFSETLASPELSETLAGDLGVTTGVLDPIEGLGEGTKSEDYLSLMRRNLTALQEANRC